MRSGILASVLLVVVAMVAGAAADPETAKQHASAAEVLAARGELVAAAARYREAFAADPRPEYGCNVGVAYYKADDLPRAHRYLADCERLGASLDPAYLAQVRTVLVSVEDRLAAGDYFPVDFVVEPAMATITVEGGLPHDEPLVGSRRAWFPFGAYRLTLRAPGFTDKQLAIEHRSREPVALREKLELPLAPAIDPRPPAPIEAAPVGATSVVISPPVAPVIERPAASRTPAVVASISTGVVALSAGLLYLRARSLAGDAGDQLDYGAFSSQRDRAESYQHASWIVGGLAGAGAIVSGYLWVRAMRSSTRAEVSATGSGGMVSIHGAF